ncbi:MAG: hypothetical protein DRH30_00855 [Deltaproteobacteria bacterium]|nr:MAG: hypothetical protein DRH30_00855 [Deltaproteobacteria bacterium]
MHKEYGYEIEKACSIVGASEETAIAILKGNRDVHDAVGKMGEELIHLDDELSDARADRDSMIEQMGHVENASDIFAKLKAELEFALATGETVMLYKYLGEVEQALEDVEA